MSDFNITLHPSIDGSIIHRLTQETLKTYNRHFSRDKIGKRQLKSKLSIILKIALTPFVTR
jgi:hypothetical protein